MDKFVVKKEPPDIEKKRKNHKAINITAKDRVRSYPGGTFHESNGILFCSSCNVVVDHNRKCVLDKHLESVSHIDRKAKGKNEKQQTLQTSFNSKKPRQEEMVKVCHEWIKVCAAANIPLHKSDNSEMRKFLHSRVKNGGSIPYCSQLRDHYLFDVYQAEKNELKKLIEGRQIAVIVDELSDDEGRYVLDVMAVVLDFDALSPNGKTVAYLLDSQFLSETNNKTVSQAVVKTMVDNNISFDNVCVFNSDTVAYMKKAFQDTLSCLFPLCVHITCHSHIVNLVASDFKKSFKQVNEFVKCFRNLFYVPSGRKSRFLNFLNKTLDVDIKHLKMPPNPTTKSWSAWFDSAIYHAEYHLQYREFIDNELQRGRNAACNSLLRLEEMYYDDEFMKQLHAQLMLIKDKAPTILAHLDFFSGKGTYLFNK